MLREMHRRERATDCEVARRKLAVAGRRLYWSSWALNPLPEASISSSSMTWPMESHQYESASRGCTSSVDQQRTGEDASRAPTSTSGVMGDSIRHSPGNGKAGTAL